MSDPQVSRSSRSGADEAPGGAGGRTEEERARAASRERAEADTAGEHEESGERMIPPPAESRLPAAESEDR
jgi:hypothetical protein